jgi:hypothetical protein
MEPLIRQISKVLFSREHGVSYLIKFLAVFTIVVILLMSVGNINFVEMYGGIIATLAVGMIAIFIAQHVLFRKNVSVVDTSDMILGVIILIAWTLLFLYNGTKVSYERHAWIKLITFMTTAFAIVVGVYLFGSLFGNYLRSLKGVVGIIAYIVMFIPCMVVDMIDSIALEIMGTTPNMFTLYTLEAVALGGLLYLPQIVRKLTTYGSTPIQMEPIFINKRTAIKSYDEIREYDNNPDEYAIAGWVYINSSTTTKGGGSIIKYGDVEITYHNGILIFKDGVVETGKTNISLQKWNHFAINKSYNTVDIFINGKLEDTRDWAAEKNTPYKYSPKDVIYVGDKSMNGAVGGIKYFNAPLSRSAIAREYNFNSILSKPFM